MGFTGFKPSFTTFLKELAANNNRDWFQANKRLYQDAVQQPFLDFVAALAGPLQTVSPHLQADSRKTGGSMMRIYRDTRFSKDKTPYNTHISARFLHVEGKEGVAPGCFLRIRPEDVVVGAGLWQPDNVALTKIRHRIDQEREAWGKISAAHSIEAGCGMYAGDMLKRPPRGFSPDHPFVEDLKRKSFAVFTTWPVERIYREDFLTVTVENYRSTVPLMGFLADALGVPF